MTSPSTTSYFSTNSSSNRSTLGGTSSPGIYGQNHSTYPRNQPFTRQQPTIMSPKLPMRRQLPSESSKHLQSSRVSFIGQGGKTDAFSTCSSILKNPTSILPSVHFSNSSVSGIMQMEREKDEMMWLGVRRKGITLIMFGYGWPTCFEVSITNILENVFDIINRIILPN